VSRPGALLEVRLATVAPAAVTRVSNTSIAICARDAPLAPRLDCEPPAGAFPRAFAVAFSAAARLTTGLHSE
jgi:hypothetical protein